MPAVADEPITMVIVEAPEPGAASEVGLKFMVTPPGRPEAERVTGTTNEPTAVVDTVAVLTVLRARVSEVGATETDKVAGVATV